MGVGKTAMFVVDLVTLGVKVAQAATPLIKMAMPWSGVHTRA
jgi:hypothetical protein